MSGDLRGRNLRSTEVPVILKSIALRDPEHRGTTPRCVLQWQTMIGMSERELVDVSEGCTVQNRSPVHKQSSEAFPFSAGLDDPIRIHRKIYLPVARIRSQAEAGYS